MKKFKLTNMESRSIEQGTCPKAIVNNALAFYHIRIDNALRACTIDLGQYKTLYVDAIEQAENLIKANQINSYLQGELV